MIEYVYSIDGITLTEENGITRLKPRRSANLFTINPTRTGLGWNPVMRTDRPATVHLWSQLLTRKRQSLTRDRNYSCLGLIAVTIVDRRYACTGQTRDKCRRRGWLSVEGQEIAADVSRHNGIKPLHRAGSAGVLQTLHRGVGKNLVPTKKKTSYISRILWNWRFITSFTTVHHVSLP